MKVEFRLDHLPAKVLSIVGRKVEGVIDEVEVSAASLPQLRQPLHDLGGRTSPYRSALNSTGRTKNAVQRTASPALHRHPELALGGGRRNPKTGLGRGRSSRFFSKFLPCAGRPGK